MVLFPENRGVSDDLAKTGVYAVLKSMLLRGRNRAARAKLSTPFGQKTSEVLARKHGKRKRVPKALIMQLTTAYGQNSMSIQWIGAAFRAWISGPGLLVLCWCHQDNQKWLQIPLTRWQRR